VPEPTSALLFAVYLAAAPVGAVQIELVGVGNPGNAPDPQDCNNAGPPEAGEPVRAC